MDIIIKKQELENISSLLPTIIYNELLKFTEEPISIEGDVTSPTTESVVETKIDKSVLLIKIKLFKKALEKDKSNKVLKIKIKLFEKELTKYAKGGGVEDADYLRLIQGRAGRIWDESYAGDDLNDYEHTFNKYYAFATEKAIEQLKQEGRLPKDYAKGGGVEAKISREFSNLKNGVKTSYEKLFTEIVDSLESDFDVNRGVAFKKVFNTKNWDKTKKFLNDGYAPNQVAEMFYKGEFGNMKYEEGGMMAKGGGVGSYKNHKVGDFVEKWGFMGKSKIMKIIGFEDGRKTYILESEDGKSRSYTPKKYIANLSGEFPLMANGGGVGDVYKLIDGENTWYLTYLDSTHFFLSNTKEYKGSPYHIGEFRSRPFYNEVLSWLNSNKGKMAKGGGVDYNENREMVLNDNKQIAHHTKELQSAVKGKNVPAWVVAKVNRSASDLSDSTHYMEGQGESYADGGSIKIGDKVMLPEIKMRDGKIQFEKVENGEVIEIQDGIYSVLNPKTNRIHQVSLNQIKFNNGGSLEEIISTQISKYNKELRKLKSDYRGDWFDTSHEGFLAIDKGERASDWEFHGEEFSQENLKKMFALYPNAKYIIFSTRLNGRSDENENESGVALDHSIMEFYVPKYDNGGGVGREKIMEEYSQEVSDLRRKSYPKMSVSQAVKLASELMLLNYSKEELKEAINNDRQIQLFGMQNTWLNALGKANKFEGGGVFNGKYLDTISSDKKNKILKNIANNYGFSIAEALAEVVDADAEMLYEYISNDQSLRMSVYNDIEGGKFAKGGGVGKMSNEMYEKLDKITDWKIIKQKKHPLRSKIFLTLSQSGNYYRIAPLSNGKIVNRTATYFTQKELAEKDYESTIKKYFVNDF